MSPQIRSINKNVILFFDIRCAKRYFLKHFICLGPYLLSDEIFTQCFISLFSSSLFLFFFLKLKIFQNRTKKLHVFTACLIRILQILF